MSPKILIVPVAALLATTFAGCAQFSNSAGVPGLKVDTPRECKRIAYKVPEPRAEENDDAFDIAGRYRAAWLTGNRRLAAVAKCDDTQADRYAKGK